MAQIASNVNGSDVTFEPRGHTAIDAIRADLGLTGAKLVCGAGSCGACVVHVDGVPVASCLLPVEDLQDATVRTIEGVALGDELHPVQKAFMEHDGLQCGFCTPGFVMEAVAFHDAWREQRGTERPTREDVAKALAGHLCRCGAYEGIHAAVQDACEGRFDAVVVRPARTEAREKVTGAARYTVDVDLPGMLHARMVRSSFGHAHIERVDTSAAASMPDVIAFAPMLPSDDRVRYVGDIVGAVAATTEDSARRAAAAVQIQAEELPVVVGLDAALADDAVDIHGRGWSPANASEGKLFPTLRRGNLRGPLSVASTRRFAARRAVAAAQGDPLLVEGRWEFPDQIHTALEPHACVADWRPDGLTVYVSTQGVSHIRDEIAERFEVDPERVTVVAEHVGGAFGAKAKLYPETIAAIELSRATGRPVRLVFDRAEEMITAHRPGARIDFGLAGTPDGALPPMVMTSHADGGVSAGQTIAVFGRMAYRGTPRSLLDYDVLTNGPPGNAFRAPGAPLAFATIEGAVDEYAVRLDRDPIALRMSWGESGLRRRVYEWALARPLWRDRPEPAGGRFRRAVGVAFGYWTLFYDPATVAEVSSSSRGFVVKSGLQDMGNGARTATAAAVADTLGVDRDLVAVEIGRSGDAWGPVSAGSRTTPSIYPAAVAASLELRERLVEEARTGLGLEEAEPVPGGLDHAGEFVPWSDLLERLTPTTVRGGRPKDSRRAITPFALPGIGIQVGYGLTHSAHIVEVEVDTRLGRVRTLRVDGAIAAGRIHVPVLARSQGYGGIIQGIGYALHEERWLDPVSGLNVTSNLDDYRIPGIAEMPEITLDFIEEGFEHAPDGGAGLAELATAAVAGAVGNAVSRAVGHRFTRFPIRPQDVVEVTR